jgi:multidrug resistance protein, MATE family
MRFSISYFRAKIKDPEIRQIARDSWSVSWPMAMIMFYEFFIGITDVYVAGKFGKMALAAYGFTFQLYFVFIIVGIALTIGTVAVSSRLFTSSDRKAFDTAVGSSLLMAVVIGTVFTVAGVLFSGRIVGMFGLSPQLKYTAAPFMAIYSAGFVFDYVLMNANGLLRASRMANKSLIAMSVACILNVILDFLLAFHTPLGLKGIALATVISLFAGVMVSLYYSSKLVKVFDFSFSVVKRMLSISWPSGLLQVLWQGGALVFFLILNMMPRHNVEIMAAFTNGLKIESAIFLPSIAFSMANAVVVGNFMGKGDSANAFRGGIITAGMGLCVATVMSVAVMLSARNISSFLTDNPIVIKESVRYLYIALLAEPALAWGIIIGGGLNGAGDTRSVMLNTAISVWLVRIPLAYLLGIKAGLGPVAVWWAMALSLVVQAVLMTARFRSRKWARQVV